MNNKYAQGNLFVVYFDKYGTRKEKVSVKNYMVGRAMISKYIKANPESSGIMERIVFNSKDAGVYDIE